MAGYRRVVKLVRSLGVEPIVHKVAGSLYRVETQEPVLHFTFDDGPHPDVTPDVLEVLDEYGAKATFFIVTKRAQQHPDLVAETLRRGHEIALHTRTHPRLTELSSKKLDEEIRGAQADLEDVAGREVRWFRPPYGAQNLRSLAVVRRGRMRTLLWSLDSKDWKGLTPDTALAPSLGGLVPGAVVLLHDIPVDEEEGDDVSRGFISKADLTRLLLEETSRRGLKPVSLDELLDAGIERRKAKLG